MRHAQVVRWVGRSSLVTRLYRALLAVVLSTALTVGAFGLGQGAPGFARAAFWPAMLVVKAAGNGPNLGTPDQPAYEWTPVHEIAVGVGLILSWLVYVMLFYAMLGGSREYIGQAKDERAECGPVDSAGVDVVFLP